MGRHHGKPARGRRRRRAAGLTTWLCVPCAPGVVVDALDPAMTAAMMCRRQWVLGHLGHATAAWTTTTTAGTQLLGGGGDAVVRSPETWDPPGARSVRLPLQPCFDGSAYCLAEYRVAGVPIRRLAVLDTGSPFLNAVPRAAGEPACLADTDEIFAGSSGVVRWRRGDVVFPGDGAGRDDPELRADLVYGVPDASLLRAPHGGLFFGLAKRRAPRIRPTLLEQLGSVKALSVELRPGPPAGSTRDDETGGSTSISTDAGVLTLSRDRLIPASTDALRIVDLRQYYYDGAPAYGAPVEYFAARARRIVANDRDVAPEALGGAPIVVIFDTGLTGIEVSDGLAEALGPLRQIGVELLSEQGRPVRFAATRRRNPRFVVTPLALPWGHGRVHIIALGLAFLDGKRLVVDVDDRRLLVEDLGIEPAATT